MAGPLSVEPSMEAILAAVFPERTAVRATREALRRRVSRVVLCRAGGLGEIDGGELVLAPPGRGAALFARLADLEAAGIVAIVSPDDPPSCYSDHSLSLVQTDSSLDLRPMAAEIERFIARRRRELFALGQTLHRALTEAAIGGSEVPELLRTASRLAERPVLLDRDGSVEAYPHPGALNEAVIRQVRIAAHGSGRPIIFIPSDPAVLAAPVIAGDERRGTVVLADAGPPQRDGDEAILSALASACAIALARVPESAIPPLASVLADPAGSIPLLSAGVEGRVTALALTADGASVRQLERASGAELQARALSLVAAHEGETLILLVQASDSVPWEAAHHAVQQRLGTRSLRMGVGRERRLSRELPDAVREAQLALRFAPPGTSKRFDSVEIPSLFAASPAWREFARHRLRPLLDGGAAGRDLHRTLATYLASGRNARETARLLHVHRNTLLYRLKRVEELLGVDLSDAETLFQLDVATRVLDVVSADADTA